MWLTGCLLLGIGVLAKTAPLVLAPLVAPGARVASHGGRALGAALFLGPAALGLAVIAALVPIAVWDHVITYRSTRGFFGLSGMVGEFGAFETRFAAVSLAAVAALAAVLVLWRRLRPVSPGSMFLLVSATVIVAAVWLVEALERLADASERDRYSGVFTVALVVGVIWLFLRLRRESPPTVARLFLLVSVIFMAVVAFGTGYGAHYAYWFLPALVATYVLLDDGWRRLLRIAWIVAALTYAIEYALVSFLGAWAVAMFGERDWLSELADHLATPHHWVVFRLPLFGVYLVVIAAGIERLARREGPAAART
jgi:hypothetical protein